MRRRGQKGVTLIELLVAVVILAIVSGPIMLLLQNAYTHTAVARDITIASFAAQQLMEELIDLDWDELKAKRDDLEVNDYNGYAASIEITRVSDDIDELANVRVTITSNGRKITFENVLYVPDAWPSE